MAGIGATWSSALPLYGRRATSGVNALGLFVRLRADASPARRWIDSFLQLSCHHLHKRAIYRSVFRRRIIEIAWQIRHCRLKANEFLM
jgi:hypothetical protein